MKPIAWWVFLFGGAGVLVAMIVAEAACNQVWFCK